MPAPTPIPQRRLAVAQVRALIQGGASQRQACAEAGVSDANFIRWSRELDNPSPEPKGRPGRKPVLELTDAQADRLRFWHLTKGSVPLALEFFLRDDLCTPEVAQFIRGRWLRAVETGRRPSWPASIRRALHVTAAEVAQHRGGSKRLSEVTATERRGAFWISADGVEMPLLPNSIWESDDMSVNEPFRFFDADSGRERLGRQTLQTLDVFTHRWLGATLVGRTRDAYRIEDIADHFADLAQTHGLPLVWRVEKGVWDNHWLMGIPMPDGTTWGGIADLVTIAQKTSSQAKGNVEGSFNIQQALAAAGWDGADLTLGRQRGEFHHATRHYLRAQNGRDESLTRFPTVDAAGDALARVLAYANTRPKARTMLGGRLVSPDALYKEHAAQDQARPLHPADAWRFLPVKRASLHVRAGVVTISAPHYPSPFRFRVNGAEDEGLLRPHLDQGHLVHVAFHPGHPELGCTLHNADRSKLNRDNLPYGAPLGQADYMPLRPQEDFSNPAERPNADARKRERAAVRRTFRAITQGIPTRKTYAQDSLGNRLAVHHENGQPVGPVRPVRPTTPDDLPTADDLDAMEAELAAHY